MSHESRIVRALQRALDPLALVLVRAGVSIRPVLKGIRAAYIKAAKRYLEERGERSSKSAISRITGITRKEIAATLSAENDAQDRIPRGLPRGDLGNLVSIWANAVEFLDEDGEPRELSLDQGEHSVTRLIRKAGMSSSRQELLDQFLNSDSVEQTSEGRFRMVRRDILVGKDLAQLIEDAIASAASTLPRNYKSPNDTRFLQQVIYVYPPNEQARRLAQKLAEKKLATFTEELDDQLESLMLKFEAPQDEHPTAKRVGVACCYFEMD